MTERKSSLQGDRQSVPVGCRPERFTIKDAGNPGDKVVWQVSGAAGRMENVDATVREDRTASGQYIPYGIGEAEVMGVIEGDFENAHTFRISVLKDPNSRPTDRPSAVTPSGVPGSWINDFTDLDIDALFEPRGEGEDWRRTTPRIPDTRQTPVPMGEPEVLREAVVPTEAAAQPKMSREAVVPTEPTVQQESLPTERAEETVIVTPPADVPLTADERRSITGNRGRRVLNSRPMLVAIIAVVLVVGFGIIALLSRSLLGGNEALNEAARRTAAMHAEVKKAPAPRAETIDLGCSTAPIRANPDGTYEMEACVD